MTEKSSREERKDRKKGYCLGARFRRFVEALPDRFSQINGFFCALCALLRLFFSCVALLLRPTEDQQEVQMIRFLALLYGLAATIVFCVLGLGLVAQFRF